MIELLIGAVFVALLARDAANNDSNSEPESDEQIEARHSERIRQVVDSDADQEEQVIGYIGKEKPIAVLERKPVKDSWEQTSYHEQRRGPKEVVNYRGIKIVNLDDGDVEKTKQALDVILDSSKGRSFARNVQKINISQHPVHPDGSSCAVGFADGGKEMTLATRNTLDGLIYCAAHEKRHLEEGHAGEDDRFEAIADEEARETMVATGRWKGPSKLTRVPTAPPVTPRHTVPPASPRRPTAKSAPQQPLFPIASAFSSQKRNDIANRMRG